MESWGNLPRDSQEELVSYDPGLCWKPLEWEQLNRQPWNTYDTWSGVNALQPPGAALVGEKNAHGKGWWSQDPRDSDDTTLWY